MSLVFVTKNFQNFELVKDAYVRKNDILSLKNISQFLKEQMYDDLIYSKSIEHKKYLMKSIMKWIDSKSDLRKLYQISQEDEDTDIKELGEKCVIEFLVKNNMK